MDKDKNDEKRIIRFPVNKYEWVLLFQRLGPKVILRAESYKNRGRVIGSGGHNMAEIEMEGGVIARPKLWDISKFIEKDN